MARVAKSLAGKMLKRVTDPSQNADVGYAHREHRSKKGRHYNPGVYAARARKKKLEADAISALAEEVEDVAPKLAKKIKRTA